MVASVEFSLRLIGFPRKTELLSDGYMIVCWHSGSQAGREGWGVSTFFLCVFSSQCGILMSTGYALFPLRDSTLLSSENNLLVIGWDWEKIVTQALRVKRETWGPNCILEETLNPSS